MIQCCLIFQKQTFVEPINQCIHFRSCFTSFLFAQGQTLVTLRYTTEQARQLQSKDVSKYNASLRYRGGNQRLSADDVMSLLTLQLPNRQYSNCWERPGIIHLLSSVHVAHRIFSFLHI